MPVTKDVVPAKYEAERTAFREAMVYSEELWKLRSNATDLTGRIMRAKFQNKRIVKKAKTAITGSSGAKEDSASSPCKTGSKEMVLDKAAGSDTVMSTADVAGPKAEALDADTALKSLPPVKAYLPGIKSERVCRSCRKRIITDPCDENTPPLKKRRSLPARNPLESDVTYAFRVLAHLENTGAIFKEQNIVCRKILSEETARGLTSALMEYAVGGDEDRIKKTICSIVPPPEHRAATVAKAVANELKRGAKHTVVGSILKGISYVAVAAGSAALMQLKQKFLN